MLCDICVEKIIKQLQFEADCPTDMMWRECERKGCKRDYERMLSFIHKFTLPDKTAKNAYSCLQDISAKKL
jgi:hypothetical protein